MATQEHPPLGFHFSVNFALFPGENGFQQVDGLQVDLGEFTWSEGGENTFTHRFPDRPKHGDLKLKRGILIGSPLILWCQAGIENFVFLPMEVIVSLLDENHVPIQAWAFRGVWPKGWQVESFDAMNNKVAVENLTLSYQYFTRIPI